MARQVGAVLGLLFLAHTAAAQFIQQGSKLVAKTPSGCPAGRVGCNLG